MFTDELGTGDRLLSIAGGVLLLFLGVAMLSSQLVTPIARRRRHCRRAAPAASAGRLASGNSVRNPGRTAATAAALMIGIALVSFIATLTNGMKASNREAIEEQVVADYVVTSLDGYTPFVAAAGDALAASPGARGRHERPLGRRAGRTATRPRSAASSPTRSPTRTSSTGRTATTSVLATLGRTNAVVSANFAEDHDIAVGDTVTIRSTAGRTADVTVVGTFEPPPFYPLHRERERLDASCSTRSTTVRATAGRGRTSPASRPTRTARSWSRRSPASPTRSSRRVRSGSTARTRTSTSSSRSST